MDEFYVLATKIDIYAPRAHPIEEYAVLLGLMVRAAQGKNAVTAEDLRGGVDLLPKTFFAALERLVDASLVLKVKPVV